MAGAVGSAPGGIVGVVTLLDRHCRIVWALVMREMATRYGRDNLGFLWVIAEPMIFCSAVSVIYSMIRTPFESGIPIVQFTITGYMPMILVRNTVNYASFAVPVNSELLYHRIVTPLHLFISRCTMEFLGVTAAFIVIIFFGNVFGYIGLPRDILKLLSAWLLLAWLAFALTLILGALTAIFEFVERFVQILTYIFLPLSGAFFMVAILPPRLRPAILTLPFIHCFELLRSGYFGRFLPVFYNVPYVVAWNVVLTLLGLLLIQFVRSRIEVL